MVVATQFALSDTLHEYRLIPNDHGVMFIGSDNSSDGIRILRKDHTNASDELKIVLGNVSSSYQWSYTAAFGILNEDNEPVHISHINVSSERPTYMKIWVHGDRDTNVSEDPTSILLYDNGTVFQSRNSTTWMLAPGDNNANTTCSNISLRKETTDNVSYDSLAQVRYSYTNRNATNSSSDFVWVQVELFIPPSAVLNDGLTGSIYIHFIRD